MKKLIAGFSGIAVWTCAAANAQLTPGGIAMQPANSALAEEVHFFHNGILLPIITIISLLILALLLLVIARFNAKANPSPRKFSHNTLIEVIWTAAPILILLVIALPSFELLFKEGVVPDGKQVVAPGDGQTIDFVFTNDFPERRMVKRRDHLQVMLADASGTHTLKYRDDYRVEGFGEPNLVVTFNQPPAVGDRVIIRGGRSTQNAYGCPMAARYFDRCEKEIVMAPTMTLKVNGYQWGWTYYYPDFGGLTDPEDPSSFVEPEFTSNMLPDDQVSDPMLRKLEVDNRVIVPVGETIRVTTTAQDVIHAWTLPAFAIKVDAVPGRINETWFEAKREGVYYGQCSEICGIKHSYMPIAVEVVSRPVFEAWIDEQRALIGLEPMFGESNKTLTQAAETGAAAG